MEKHGPRKNAIEILETAVHLLRHCPARLFLTYYLGSLPFFLAFLYFWGDMSRSAFAGKTLAPASLSLALLFVWMKFQQSLFALGIHDRASHGSRNPPGPLSLFRLFAFQAGVHASGFILLPAALAMTLPYGWAYAFYQSVLLQEPEESARPGNGIRRALKNSAYAPRQNHQIILILVLFKGVVFLNVGALIYGVPQLLKSFFGIETVFTLGGFSVMNSTFLTTVYCLTHLAVDPLVKTVYVLRCFQCESETSGADITAELKRLSPPARSTLTALIPVLCLFLSLTVVSPGNATPPGTPEKPSRQTLTEEARTLDSSIKTVMERREYAWRLPREKSKAPEKEGIFDAFFKWLTPYWDKFTDTMKRWWQTFRDWIDRLFPTKNVHSDKKNETTGGSATRYLLYGLLGFCLAFLGILLFRWLISAQRIHEITAEPVDVRVDLTDESLKADDHPCSVWTAMSRDLMDQGEYRLALRALYLATLSHLAESGLITVHSCKSNREYVDELNRRAHEKKDLIHLFSGSVTVFDGAWYGRIPVGRDDVIRFSENQERIYSHAV